MDSEYVLAVFDAYYKHNIEGTLAAFSTNVSETLVKELVAGGAEIENYVNDCLEQTSLAGISVVAQDYVNKWVGQIPLVPDDLFKFIPDEMAENIRKGNADHEELKLKNILNVLPLDIFNETYKELEKDLKYSSDYHPVSAISGEYVGKIIKAYLAWEISKDINKEPVPEGGKTSIPKTIKDVEAPILPEGSQWERNVLNSFAGGKSNSVTYEGGTVLYRVGGENGGFWSLDAPPATEYQWRVDTAIKQEFCNDASTLYKMTIPQGASLSGIEGKVGSQGMGLYGGAHQVYIDYRAVPEDWIETSKMIWK